LLRKYTKRLLAALLTFALAFSVALPAFAEDDPSEEPNPAMPVITAQPQSHRFRFDDRPRELNLSVEAHIPGGDEIGYQWYRGDVLISGEKTIYVNLPEGEGSDYYHVVVYNVNHPEYRVTSETARVEVYISLFNYIMLVLTTPTVFAGALILLGGPIGSLLLIVFSPLFAPLIALTLPVSLLGLLFDRINTR